MRYLPLTDADRQQMLEKIGASAIDDLYKDVPSSVYDGADKIALPSSATEMAVERHLAALSAKSRPAGSGPFYCGAGAYRHHVPASVDHLIQRSEFLTSYTPYQPEISQGTLQVLFEFQTQVAAITGMEIANASMYDGSTATAEAVLMAMRVTRRKGALISGSLHPQYAATVHTLTGLHGNVVSLDQGADIVAAIDDTTACVVVQTPDVFGNLSDYTALAEAAHAKGALLIVVVTEVFSLGLLKSPGEMGADIVCAEGQSIGNGLNYGGPYVGLMAAKKKFVRQMPGRLCGETVDANGKRGFVLTLSTREQHIRREKATSNICTNSGLCALAFSIHMTLMGEPGFTGLAAYNHTRAVALAGLLTKVPGVKLATETFFNEFTIELPKAAAPVVEALAEKGIIAGVPASRLFAKDPSKENLLIVAVTETTTDEDDAAFAAALTEVLA